MQAGLGKEEKAETEPPAQEAVTILTGGNRHVTDRRHQRINRHYG